MIFYEDNEPQQSAEPAEKHASTKRRTSKKKYAFSFDRIYISSFGASGRGLPGCIVTITWPDGRESQTHIDHYGRWFSFKPYDLTLKYRSSITAAYTCTDGTTQVLERKVDLI
jgi:hypothetical protein